jgi:outer membrane protein
MRFVFLAGLILGSAALAYDPGQATPTAAAPHGAAPQPPLELTLQQAEKIALQNNPRLSAAQYAAAASAEVPKQYRANFQPTAFGSLTAAGASDGTRIAAGALNNPIIYNRFASGIGVSQLITDFGRTSNLASSAEAHARAQQQNSNATRADVLLDVDTAYFGVLRAQSVLKVAEETVAARQLVAEQIAVLAKNSLKSNLDVSFANVNLSEAKLLLASAQNELKAAEARLATALGYPNQRYFKLADEPMPPAPPDSFDALIAEAIRNRPELASLRYEQESAASLAKAERALWYPTVSMIANIGLVPMGVSALQNQYGAVGANINIPIFNGGLFKARRSEAELRERSAEERVKDLQNRVVRDVQLAYLNALNGYERLGLTNQLLDQARMALDLAQSRYDLGLSSIVELSQAQLNLTSAQIAQASARYDYQAQWSALEYQIGALR